MELVIGDARFHTWAVASRLLDAAGEFRWCDAGEGLEGCRLALAVSSGQPTAELPAPQQRVLQALPVEGKSPAPPPRKSSTTHPWTPHATATSTPAFALQ